MFHGESQVFSEGVEEGKVGFCMIFFSEGSTSVVDEVGVGAPMVARRWLGEGGVKLKGRVQSVFEV